jgi:ComF family protein
LIIEPHQCPDCIALKPVFKSTHALFSYAQTGETFIQELKYKQGLYLENDIHRIIRARPLPKWAYRPSIIVPIPLHPRKKRERGYNQSDLIARSLHKHLPQSELLNLLNRTTDSQSQTRLTREERLKNMRHVFSLNPKMPNDLYKTQKTLILVDDVYTTGATLQSAAQKLSYAGWNDIYCFTLAHG